jgi:hypothetical protein
VIVMSRLMGLAGLAIFSANAVAQDAGTRMSREDLLAFLPGTKVSHISSTTGSQRTWTNEPDGHFVASSDGKGYMGNALGTRSATARGTWSVNDQGKYCIEIDWRNVNSEKWCSSILKTADGNYYLGVVAQKSRIEFTK